MKTNHKYKIIISSIFLILFIFFIYKSIISPKIYTHYLDEGISYFMNKEYDKSIESFDKAIKVNKKSSEAQLYKAKSYLEKSEFENCINTLKELQIKNLKNESILIEILKISNCINPDISYDFLNKFVKEVGIDNLSSSTHEIYNSAYELPPIPNITPKEGRYLNSISIKFNFDKIIVGQSYYYTLDGSLPNQNSQKYIGKIDINKDTTLKVVGYNKNNECSDVITIEYSFAKSELKEYLDKAKQLYSSSSEGTNTGEYKKGSKSKLLSNINKAEDIYNKDNIDQKSIDTAITSLKKAIKIFNDSKILFNNPESVILGKYTYDPKYNGISLFTKNVLVSGWIYSESCNLDIASKKILENTIYYTSTDGYKVKIEIIDNNTIKLNDHFFTLFDKQGLIKEVYEDEGPEYASIDALQYFKITQNDIDKFYSNIP